MRFIILGPQVHRVCELGGGMTCLAGLVAAAATADSERSPLELLLLTDGNEKSMDNLSRILGGGCLANSVVHRGAQQIHPQVLKWCEKLENIPSEWKATFDLILCADCFFFEEVHADLLQCITALLSPGGQVVSVAPSRGKSLDRFVNAAQAAGFSAIIEDSYCSRVTTKHHQFLKQDTFTEDIHYPLLLMMTK